MHDDLNDFRERKGISLWIHCQWLSEQLRKLSMTPTDEFISHDTKLASPEPLSNNNNRLGSLFRLVCCNFKHKLDEAQFNLQVLDFTE